MVMKVELKHEEGFRHVKMREKNTPGKGGNKSKGSETRTNLEGSRNRSKVHMAGACGQRAAWKEKGPEK